MPPLPKKARNKAIARAKARLDKRSYGNDLWQVVLQYGYGEPNLQMAYVDGPLLASRFG